MHGAVTSGATAARRDVAFGKGEWYAVTPAELPKWRREFDRLSTNLEEIAMVVQEERPGNPRWEPLASRKANMLHRDPVVNISSGESFGV